MFRSILFMVWRLELYIWGGQYLEYSLCRMGRMSGLRFISFRFYSILVRALYMEELRLLPISLPPATITARFRQFSGLKEGVGRADVDVAISKAEPEEPKVVTLKFFGK